MSGHTKGPWTVTSPWSGFSSIHGADGGLVFGLAAGGFDEARPAVECEANARLIAAAPELVEVCAAIAPYLGAVDANDWRGLKDDDAISMPVKMRVGDLRALKAAISRATEAQP